MLCTALGLPPESFRCVDVNNAGICFFRYLQPPRHPRLSQGLVLSSINKMGEPMLTGLNLTSHLHVDGVRY